MGGFWDLPSSYVCRHCRVRVCEGMFGVGREVGVVEGEVDWELRSAGTVIRVREAMLPVRMLDGI